LTAWGIAKAVNEFTIKKYGAESTGIYVKYEEVTVARKNVDTTYRNIFFTFENQDGETVETKTGFVYRDFEAEALSAMGTFPVKYKGKKAIIMVDKKALEK
jgi:hypothetical protein